MVIHLMIPIEMVFNWVQRVQRPRKVIDMIDLTNNRSKTNTNNVRTVTSTIDNDSDVEIVDDPADLEEGIQIPENYIREKEA